MAEQARGQFARLTGYAVAGLLAACAVEVLLPAASRNWTLLLALLLPAGSLVFGIATILRERREAVGGLRAAVEALEASEARYHALFSESPVIQLLADHESGRIVDASRTAAVFYGWSVEELRGRELVDLSAGAPVGSHAVLRGGGGITNLHLVAQHRLASGEVRTVEVQTGPVTVNGRRLDVATVRDITAEIEARRQVARLAAVVESSAEAIITTDLDGTVTGWNPAATSLYGYSRGEAIGRNVADLLGPIAIDQGELAALVRAGESVHLPMAARVGAGGEPIPVDLVISPILTDGRVVGMSRIGRDLRPELAEAARVRRNEALLADASQIGRIGAWELDPGTGRAAWTEHLYRIAGIEPGEPVTADTLVRLAHPDDRERVAAAFDAPADGSAPIAFRIVRLDGSERSLVATRRFVPADETTASLEVGVVRDVTEERALEEQLRQAQKIESIGLLTGGVAHDFNNLLTAIGGFAELARVAAADGESPEADLLQVEAAVERARTLTSQLLSFGRRSIVRARPVSLATAVSALAPILGRLLGARIGILTELDPDATALIDPGQLDQVIVNLAVNARDAMPDGGNLRIAAGQAPATGDEPARVWLEVEDDGTGMPPDVVAQIFTPFFTTKERGHGTGLGLSTVQGILEQAGGRISVSSRIGEGTTFRIELPVAASAEARTADAVQRPTAAPLGGLVLLVEDEDLVRRVAERVLRRAGFQVVSASNVPDAMVLGDSMRPDVLVTDIVLPGRTDGVELARALRARWPGLPVLVMTGSTSQVPPPWAVLLPKPWEADRLVSTVARLADASWSSRARARNGTEPPGSRTWTPAGRRADRATESRPAAV